MKTVRNVAYDYDSTLPEFLQEETMDERPEVMLIDGPLKYTPATSEAQEACQRRFDDRGTTAIDDEKPGFLKHWIENFWDGPYEVKDNGDGTYTYKCPYTGRVDIFS